MTQECETSACSGSFCDTLTSLLLTCAIVTLFQTLSREREIGKWLRFWGLIYDPKCGGRSLWAEAEVTEITYLCR